MNTHPMKLVTIVCEAYALQAVKSLLPHAGAHGCTHFPVLAPAIRAVLGERVSIVDSAETTAAALVGVLGGAGLRRPAGGPGGTIRLLATDSAERFARVGGTFLGHPLQAADVEVVDLQPTVPSGPGPAAR